MAGGKASARQKMINLMYLVFIAMMAMNMSKEVLSAFGLMEAKFATSNEDTSEKNSMLLADLETKGKDKPKDFALAASKAKQVSLVSDKFYNYIETLKADLLKDGNYTVDSKTNKLPFESMDKTDILDEKWFTGDRLTKKGDEVLATIEAYKKDINDILGNDISYTSAIKSFDQRFNTEPVSNKDGKKIDFLDYNYKGFPAIASYTKLTAMQNDVKVTEQNMYNLFLGHSLDEQITLNKYKAIVLPEKSAFFAGQPYKGQVVIGKYANVLPKKIMLNGKEVDLSKAIDSTGNAELNFNVGNVGEHTFKGEFTFIEKDEEIKIPFEDTYVVVPRPNSATISADKMNVVYRGVTNPMTISFAGVPDNKVSASGAGLSKGAKSGKYNMVPTSGKEVTINVTAKLDDGKSVGDSKTFRIKDIPKPAGVIAGQTGNAKLPRNNVEIGKIGAKLEDFDFDLPLTVTGFKMKVEGQPSVTVSGSRMNAKAKAAIRKAKRGSSIQIFDIKSKSSGPRIKPASPLVIQLTN